MALTFLRNLGIISSAGISTSKLGAGAVLQVVQGTTTSSFHIVNTTYQDTTLTASITPTNASNKILVLASLTCIVVNQGGASIGLEHRLLRGDTQIEHKYGEINSGVGANSFTVENIEMSYVHLDSPNTTSSTTYKIQARSSSTANNMQLRIPSGVKMTLIEIKG
jgi:hypothetical protein